VYKKGHINLEISKASHNRDALPKLFFRMQKEGISLVVLHSQVTIAQQIFCNFPVCSYSEKISLMHT